MRKLIAVLRLSLLILVGCCPKVTDSLMVHDAQKRDSTATEKEHTSVITALKDSTWTNSDTTTAPPSSLTITGSVSADSSGKVNMPPTVINTPQGSATVSVTDGSLTARFTCPGLVRIVERQGRLIQRQEALIKDLKKEAATKQDRDRIVWRDRVKEVPYTPRGVKLLAWAGGISVALLLAWVLYRLKRLFT